MVTRSPSNASSLAESRPGTPSSARSGKRGKEEILTLLVFDDLVIVAAPVYEKSGLFAASKKKTDKPYPLRVLPELEGGIGKVLDVKDWSGWNSEYVRDSLTPDHTTLLSLTLLPLSHSVQNPLSVSTNCYTLPCASISPSPSFKNLKLGQTLDCPQLVTLGQFLTVLGQATTSSGSALSEYVIEEKEMLVHENEASWDELSGLGFAQ
jgi:hypothetical protein